MNQLHNQIHRDIRRELRDLSTNDAYVSYVQAEFGSESIEDLYQLMMIFGATVTISDHFKFKDKDGTGEYETDRV